MVANVEPNTKPAADMIGPAVIQAVTVQANGMLGFIVDRELQFRLQPKPWWLPGPQPVNALPKATYEDAWAAIQAVNAEHKSPQTEQNLSNIFHAAIAERFQNRPIDQITAEEWGQFVVEAGNILPPW